MMDEATAGFGLDSAMTPRQTSPLARRQRLLLGAACATAVISVGGMIASFWVRSPAEIAAQAKPPRANVLTAPVELKTLQRTVIFRGSFASSRSVDFRPSSVVDPSGVAGTAGGELTITRLPRRVNDPIRPGKLLAEVSYRPVFALHGRIPAIRDLSQGVSGPDVTQLQRGLAELGYGHGSDRVGSFSTGTALAVRRLYAALGYPVPTTAGGRPTSSGEHDPTGHVRKPTRPTRSVLVPKSEVMFIPSFPARIAAVSGTVGSRIGGVLLKVTLGGLTLTGHLDPSADTTARAGQDVQVLIEDTGKQYRATVAKIGKLVQPKNDETQTTQPYIPVSIVARQPWNTELNGQDARITVTSAATNGDVLAVPEGAITAPADGQTSVVVLLTNGERRRVPVIAGMSADGYVQVTPRNGQLRKGDNVVVGR